MRRNLAIAFALVIGGCVALSTLLVYLHSRETLSASVLREYRAALKGTGLQLQQSLESAEKDVLTLNGMPPVRGILRAERGGGYDAETQSSYAMWVERLQQIMGSLLRNSPDYLQVRFIDEHGEERVRMDNAGGTPEIVPQDKLQNKGRYRYFSETLKLPPGGLYVSRLNLNREQGRIETPYRPTLRLATPVYDVFNQRSGILVINLNAAGLLKKILGRLDNVQGQTYLVDQEGYFLAHPDVTKTFGFDLNHDFRLLQDHPRLAEKLNRMENFIEIVDHGESPGAAAHVHGFQKIAYDPNDSRNYWALVFEVPYAVALKPLVQQRNLQLATGLAIAVIGAITIFVWSGILTRPLKELTLTAKRIAGGCYEQRVGLAGKRDEIRELSTAFNHMVDALVAAERRLANILDAAGDAIINVDQNQRIISSNESASQIFGYKTSDVLGQTLERLLPPESAAVHRLHFRAYGQEEGLTRKMGAGREVAGRRNDGSTFPAEISISKTIEGNGPVFTAILRDVSERKCAETERAQLVANLQNAVAEANRSRAQLEAVFQAMEDGIAVLDMRGDVILVNEAETRINGYSCVQEMKRNLDYFAEIYEFHEPDGQRVPVDHWPASRCLRGETISNWVLHGRRNDTGQEWYFRFSGAPIHDPDGRQILAAIVTRDITEFKTTEQEILKLNAELEQRVRERTAELEAANKELEAFSYSVSHDLRAPLRAIDGFSQALLEDYAQQIDETGRGYLQRVRAGSMRMANLIDDMLQLSRVTRSEVQRQVLDLSALAESVMREIRSAESDRRIEITIQSGLVAEGDSRLLGIALVNLLSNAWKFTGPVAEPRIWVGSYYDGDQTVYYVRDNGVGFDMAYVDKLFGAFQRLHTENEFPGTGIGLAIVQRIVHRHGGRVWAESGLNQGTTIHFSIPSSNPN